MKIFRNCVINFLEMTLTIKMFDAFTKPCNVDSGRIIELDASRSVKFSRHLFITLPGQYVFPNNHIVSKFVNLMCNYITTTESWNTSDESKLSSHAVLMRKQFFYT